MLAAARASADHAAAERATAEAEALAGKGDYAGAAAKFHAAYVAEPNPDLICDVGVAYQKANDLPRAQMFLTECLLHGPTRRAEFVEAVRANVATIEASLRAGSYTPFDITLEPAGATITISDYPPEESIVGARIVWLPYGAHTITAQAEGYVEQTVDATARGHDAVPLHVKLARPDKTPPPPTGPSPSKLPLYVAGGATAGAIALGVVAFAFGRRDADNAHFALTQKAFAADKDAVGTWNTVLGLSSLLAIAGAATTTYLFVRYERGTRLEVVAGPTGGELRFTGSF